MHAGKYFSKRQNLNEWSNKMGVQHLWTILEQSKRVESVEHLRDKTLCIDLSLWICEAQATKGLKNQLKPYLRNVFFRTMYLVSVGVRPVFVIDGIPPEIKRETILKRLEARCEQPGKRKNVNGKQKQLRRSKFSIWCNECCDMLRLLGVPFLKSEGEAEAMCAWLNVNHYADGVFTDDGDVFLYGARVVYKDFNISSSKLLTDCLQVYHMKDIESHLGLSQRNMIALALLLGCDYLPSGVPGIGKETAIRLLNSLPGVDLLDRFREWKASPDVHPNHYTSLEISVKRKAVKVPNFPNKEVVKEFLSPNIGKKDHLNIKWTCPDLEGIKDFFFRKLEWPKEYTEEKMLNLATDWQLAYSNPSLKPLFIPTRIIKQRIKQKIEYYEVEWKTQDVQSKWPVTFVSIKPKDVILVNHSMIVEIFENEIIAKKNKGKTKKKDLKVIPAASTEETELLDSLVAKIDNMNLKETTTLPSDYGKDCEVSGETAGESAKNTKMTRELLGECIIDDKSNVLDGFPESGAHSKLTHQHLLTLDTHQTITCDLGQNALDIVCRSSRIITCADDHKKDNSEVGIIDLFCGEEGEKLTNFKCIAGTPIIRHGAGRGDEYLVEHGHNELSNYLDSPGANENTMLNLVDITIDNSFGSDLGAMEGLLASSFVAQLNDVSYGDLPGMFNYYESFRSPRPEVHAGVIPTRCSKEMPQKSINAIPPNHKNDGFLDSFERPNLPDLDEFTLSKNGSCKERRNDDVHNVHCNGPNIRRQGTEDRSCVFESSTPQAAEESSLTSRLLKRFQGKDGGIENTLRLISSGGDAQECGSVLELTTKSNNISSRFQVVSDDSLPLNNRIEKRDIAVVVLD